MIVVIIIIFYVNCRCQWAKVKGHIVIKYFTIWYVLFKIKLMLDVHLNFVFISDAYWRTENGDL